MSSKWQIFERSVIRTKHLWSQKPCFAYNNYRQKNKTKNEFTWSGLMSPWL